jgi:signal transduction histidine kinase
VATRTDPAAFGGRTPLALAINLGSLALLVWGIIAGAHVGLGGRHLVALIALLVAIAGWVAWALARYLDVPWLAPAGLVTMGLAGGVLTVYAPLALVFVGVAALGATIAWDLPVAVWIALSGPAALAIALPAAGHDAAPLGGAAAAVVAGAALGISRRESLKATAQAAHIQVAEARADAEEARAELLAGRNHLARELHDVLAHTLSALSLQLEALDALVQAGPPPTPEVSEQLQITKRLVRAGLAEARGAVRALREESPPLEDQLTRLVDDGGATLEIIGSPRRVSPDVSLALYRVAQEALTNVVKHAPGAIAAISLTFLDHQVSVSVTNQRSHGNGSPLSESGGGYGIQGIKERVLLLGGRVEAGPTDEGWRVLAEVPA